MGITRTFDRALALGVRGGALGDALRSRLKEGQIRTLIEGDLSSAFLRARPGLRLQIDEEALPFRDASLDLIVCGPILHWSNDLVGVLVQIRRALRPDGLFIGSLLGGATLTELRQCLLEADLETAGGAGPRVAPFADAFDGGALLQRAGFALPVSDLDRVSVRYETPVKLMADLRSMGETNVLVDRSRRPLTRTLLERAFALYAERFARPDGKVPATFEIITLTGWAPHESQQKPLKPGSAKRRLADALGVREGILPAAEPEGPDRQEAGGAQDPAEGGL